MDFQVITNTPIGKILVRGFDETVSEVDFLFDAKETVNSVSSAYGDHVVMQLNKFFRNSKTLFDVNLSLQGTAFQERIWQVLMNIPAGCAMTYGEIASKLGTSAQAVGNACRANPAPILVPCHRVVSQTGIGGFAGKVDGKELEVKRWLLQHEGYDLESLL